MPILIHKAKSYLDPILEKVPGDENMFLWWANEGIGIHPFEYWGNAVLGRAMVAYYAGTQDPYVLEQVEKAYENATKFSGIGRTGVNAEVMLEASEWGADPVLREKVLQRAGFLEETIKDWGRMKIIPDHGVSYNEASKIPAVYYPYIGDTAYIRASMNRYDWAEAFIMQPFGVYQSDEHMKGTGAFRW